MARRIKYRLPGMQTDGTVSNFKSKKVMRYLSILFCLFSMRLVAQPIVNSEELIFLTIDKDVLAKNGYKGCYMYDQLAGEKNLRGIYLFNANGNIESQDEFYVMNGDGDTVDLKTNYYYDEAGLLVRRTITEVSRATKDTTENTTIIFTYDKKRLVKSVSDKLNTVSTYVYNAAGKLITITELLESDNALQSKAQFTYDASGRLATIQYGRRNSYGNELRSRTIKCLYDTKGRLYGLNGIMNLEKYGTTIVFNDKGLPETQQGQDVVTSFWYNYTYCTDCKWK